MANNGSSIYSVIEWIILDQLVFELLSVYCEQGAGELSGETLLRDGTQC